ncbi:hypothetical protein PR048_030411 [Dryococelus australis]|uniref:Uncharacterized protein n=1 Tax=Dryococelus australis TaxID=614101 RepID=A0ABQ9G8X3_9NEOP|nr:hypothetical protein PR048_030411 [Dryococelus australis]
MNESREEGRRHTVYQVVMPPPAPPKTFTVSAHPIHGPVSFRTGAFLAMTPADRDARWDTNTLLVYSHSASCPNTFVPWFQDQYGRFSTTAFRRLEDFARWDPMTSGATVSSASAAEEHVGDPPSPGSHPSPSL